MRAYFFGNFYLSSIQQGIQALHTTAEMFIKYLNPPKPGHTRDMLFEWARNHKTVIVLNGGDQKDLAAISASMLAPGGNPYPHATWHEDMRSLNGTMTCVGIILPEKVYGVADELRQMPFSRRDPFLQKQDLSKFEVSIIQRIMTSPLAR